MVVHTFGVVRRMGYCCFRCHVGFNRALGSLIAGVVAVVVICVALSSGSVAEPYVIGLSIFLVGK